VIGAMTRRAVLVNPVGAPRKQAIQGRHQVRVGSGAQLDDDDPGRGVRDEDNKEAVALARDKLLAGAGQIVQSAVTPGLDIQLLGLHWLVLRRAVGFETGPG